MPRQPILCLCLLAALGAPPALSQERAYGGLSKSERLLVQDGLAWSGDYLGTIDGQIGASTVEAAKAFQRERGARATGVLTQEEIDALLAQADAAKDAIGYAAYDDVPTGIEIGLPLGLTPPAGQGERSSRFAAADSSVQIELFSADAEGDAIGALRSAALEAEGRDVTYEDAGRGWFVVTGHQGEYEFYTRVHRRGDTLVGFAVLYETPDAATVEPVIIAMSSAFARPQILATIAEPASSDVAPPTETAQRPDEAMETAVVDPQSAAGDDEEAAQGVFSPPGEPIAASIAVSPSGHYLTVASVAGCEAPSVGNSENAELVAVDEASGLALIRADALEGALVGAFADTSAAIGDRVALGTPDANLARGEVEEGDAIAMDAELAVTPGSPVLDQYGRAIAILSPGDADADGTRSILPLGAIGAFLVAEGLEPVIVGAAEAPFSNDELADSARLLTEMVYCDGPAASSGG